MGLRPEPESRPAQRRESLVGGDAVVLD